MEGRISRESLTGAAYEADERPYSPRRAQEDAKRYSNASRAGKSYSSYRRRRSYKTRAATPELIPDGRDMLIVQLLSSGVLLLFVMFVAIVDTEGTIAVREKLAKAFSASTSIKELADGAAAVKDRLAGSTDTVLEIFGGEIDNGKEGSKKSGEESGEEAPLDKDADEPVSGAVQRLSPTSNTAALPAMDKAVVDSDTLKEINENVNEYSKN